MYDLIDDVLDWAEDKGILDHGTPEGQFSKTNEEVHELGLGINAGDLYEIKDGIGDVTVTLIILAQMYGMSFEECLQYAYNEIAGRKGVMIDGVFVKEKTYNE